MDNQHRQFAKKGSIKLLQQTPLWGFVRLEASQNHNML